MAGRITLAKIVLSLIPIHIMQYFSLPTKTTSTINKLLRDFISDSYEDKRKIHLLSWSTITLPKSQEEVLLSHNVGGFALRR